MTGEYLPRLRLAMRIGSEYRVAAITGRHLPDAFRKAAEAVADRGSALPGRLADRVAEHAKLCRAALASAEA